MVISCLNITTVINVCLHYIIIIIIIYASKDEGLLQDILASVKIKMISETELVHSTTYKSLPHMQLHCFYTLCHCAQQLNLSDKRHFDNLCTEGFITNHCGSNFFSSFSLANMHGVKYILIVGTFRFHDNCNSDQWQQNNLFEVSCKIKPAS